MLDSTISQVADAAMEALLAIVEDGVRCA